jgi:hypothetical protein
MSRPDLTPLTPRPEDDQQLLRDMFIEGAGGAPLRLQMIDTGQRVPTGQSKVLVHLYDAAGERVMDTWIGVSPQHAIDSDDAVRSAIDAVAIRPGDTDDEFFDSYSPEQLAFANEHGEELMMYSIDDTPYELVEWDQRPAPKLDEHSPAPTTTADGPSADGHAI